MRGSVIGAALLVVLAGCSGAVGPPDPGGGAGTTDGPYPPGVNDGGVENVSALTAAHADALDGRSHVAELRTSNAPANGSAESTRRVAMRAGSGGQPRRFLSNATGGATGDRRSVTWTNGSVAAEKRIVRPAFGDEKVLYRRGSVARAPVGQVVRGFLGPVLKAGNYSVAGVDDDGATTLVTLNATGPAGSGNGSNASAGSDFDEFGGTVVVDSVGRIRSADLSYVAATAGLTGRIRVRGTVSYELRSVGGDVTVDRPPWLDRGLELAPDVALSLSVVDGRSVALTNAGSDPIPKGTAVTLSRNGSGTWARLTEYVAPGETVYATKTDGDGSLALTGEPPGEGEPLSGRYAVRLRPRDAPAIAVGNVTAGSAGTPASLATTKRLYRSGPIVR